MTFVDLGREHVNATAIMVRPSPQEVCRMARDLGRLPFGPMEIRLHEDSRPDLGGGFLVITPPRTRKGQAPSYVIGIVCWVEITTNKVEEAA
jgi:hypothetical protein